MPATVNLSETLADVERQASAPKPRRIGDNPGTLLTGAELMREIHGAMRSVPACRRIAFGKGGALTPEGEGIAQTVALTVLSGCDRPRGSARAVLAYMSRCERFPTLAARAGDTVARGDIGRNLLALRVRRVMAERADWQDNAAQYRTRRQSQAGERRMVEPLPDSSDAPHAPGLLARSLPTDPLRIDPADVSDLTAGVASALADSPTGERRIRARLIQACAVANGTDPAHALGTLAAEQGRTLSAVRMDASRGADLLADIEPADLLAVVRDTARAMGLARSAVWDRVDLPAGARAAARAVDALARKGGAWDAAAIGTARSLPDWQERTAPSDAAPFPGLLRPDAPAPASRVDRGPARRPDRPADMPASPAERADRFMARTWHAGMARLSVPALPAGEWSWSDGTDLPMHGPEYLPRHEWDRPWRDGEYVRIGYEPRTYDPYKSERTVAPAAPMYETDAWSKGIRL